MYKLWFDDPLKRRWYVREVPSTDGGEYMYTRRASEAILVGSRWRSRFIKYKRDLAEPAGYEEV